MDSSIREILLFKHFKQLKYLNKRLASPKYLYTTLDLNKKFFFLKNKSILVGRARLFYAANRLYSEPVIVNKLSLIQLIFAHNALTLKQKTITIRALQNLKRKILNQGKLKILTRQNTL